MGNNTDRILITIPIGLKKRLKEIREIDYTFNVSAICSQAIIRAVDRWELDQKLKEEL
jgi:hypothetical protein